MVLSKRQPCSFKSSYRGPLYLQVCINLIRALCKTLPLQGISTQPHPGLEYVQVHGDVFRPPPKSSLLSVYVGTGVQLIAMSIVTMIFAVLGFLSPAYRGGLMTAMLLLFVLMGLPGGYASARLYKTFKVESVPLQHVLRKANFRSPAPASARSSLVRCLSSPAADRGV